MNKIKSSFLVYIPDTPYERSFEPILICNSRRKAEKIQKEILDHWTAANDKLAEEIFFDREFTEEESKEFDKRWAQNEKRRNSTKNIYGIDFRYKLPIFKGLTIDFDVQIMELPVY